MKHVQIYILTALSLLLLSGCMKEKVENNDVDNVKETIMINVSTKSTLGSDDIITGTEIKLYDCVKNGSVYYTWIDGNTASYPTDPAQSTWTITGEPAGGYSWLDGVTKVDHHFFGWLAKDKDGLTDAGLFGSALTASGSAGVYTVNVPATEMTLATSQFDFSYADMVNRYVTSPDYSTVDIPLKHFFTCFGIKAHNYTSSPITLKQVKLYGLTNKKSAAITFDATAGTTSVSYTPVSKTWAAEGSALELMSSNVSMASDAESADIINRFSGATNGCYLMWPQTAAELGDTYLSVTYSVDGGADITVPLSVIPAGSDNGWDAGTRHIMELSFHDKEVTLKVVVMPWEDIKSEIDYTSTVSIKEGGELSIVGDGTFCTVVGKNVYFKGGNPITIQFALDSPIDGTWMISKEGDFDAFEIDNTAVSTYGDGIDYNYGTIDGEMATVTIYPMITDPKRDYRIKLKFAVRTSTGRVYSADEFVQGSDATQYYTIVLQAS